MVLAGAIIKGGINIDINRANQIRKNRAIYLEPAPAWTSATLICVLQRLSGGQRSDKALRWKTGRLQVCPD